MGGNDRASNRTTQHLTSRRRFLKQAAGVGLAVQCGTARVFAQARGARVVRHIGLDAQLFLDDFVIEERRHLARVLHRPTKKGLIKEADGQPWQRGDQRSVVRDSSGRFHMTYRFLWSDPSVRDLHPGIGEDKAHWFRLSAAYATSKDGVRWTKPILGLVEGPTGFRPAPMEKWKDGVFNEPSGISRENNLGCPVHSVQDLVDFGGLRDPKKRYLVHVQYRADTHNFADVTDAGLYFSADVPDIVGDENWRDKLTPIWEGPRRGPRGPSVRVAGYDAGESIWFDCTQSSFGSWRSRGGRDIARFTSADLDNWSAEELVLPVAEDESREPADWVEYMDMRADRVGDLWLGQLIIFHGDRTSSRYEMPTARGVWRKGTTEMRLITSRDAGKTWQRLGDKKPWIPHHDEDDGFDRLVFGASPVRVGDELWLYYGCWDGDHLNWNRDGTTYYKTRTRIGRTALATLRWNGFASLRAEERSGTIVTVPFRTRGRRLTVNAAARRGSVRVEVQDSEGHAVPGFALADCRPLSGDGVAQSVRWRQGEELPASLQDRPLRLRLEVRDADLFGFEFGAT